MLNDIASPELLSEQIEAVAQLTGLNEYVVEKDIYVTQAISVVSMVTNDLYELVFQGGTSLVKSHRIIQRMSEDCDFRIRLKAPVNDVSKNQRRKILRHFRQELVKALKEKGFAIEDDAIRVRNEGQFMSIRAGFPSLYPHIQNLKPYISLEFFLGDVKIKPEIKPVTTLIHQVLGERVKHPEFPVKSIAVMETAVEKWVALTRRVATSSHRQHYRDANLVRHLYDLYQINELGFFDDRFKQLVTRVVSDDRAQYKNHNSDYYKNPVKEIERAINQLRKETIWRDHWSKFLDSMVFSDKKPSYDQVLNNLREKTKLVLPELKKMDFSRIKKNERVQSR